MFSTLIVLAIGIHIRLNRHNLCGAIGYCCIIILILVIQIPNTILLNVLFIFSSSPFKHNMLLSILLYCELFQ